MIVERGLSIRSKVMQMKSKLLSYCIGFGFFILWVISFFAIILYGYTTFSMWHGYSMLVEFLASFMLFLIGAWFLRKRK
jgi:hypothetical protein